MKVFCIVALMIAAAIPAVAHHSVQVFFDESKATTLHGVITEVIWTNPHVKLTMEVKEASGSITTWQFEIASPNALSRAGIKGTSLVVMKTCDVLIWPARDGSHSGAGRTVTFEGGTALDLHDRFEETHPAKTPR